MQKIYAYEPARYRSRIVLVGCFLVAIAITLSAMYIQNPGQVLFLFGIAAAVYGALNTFVFKSNPREVVVDDEAVSFASFGEARYKISNLKTFDVREFSNAQLYIRVEDKSGRRGRYWVNYYYFSERENLIYEMYHIEKLVNPASFKFRGRESMFSNRPCQTQKGGVPSVE